MPRKRLSNLKVGDAFEFEGKKYIAFALTPDPFEVYCLNVETKKLEEIYESEMVEALGNWELNQIDSKMPKGRDELDVL